MTPPPYPTPPTPTKQPPTSTIDSAAAAVANPPTTAATSNGSHSYHYSGMGGAFDSGITMMSESSPLFRFLHRRPILTLQNNNTSYDEFDRNYMDDDDDDDHDFCRPDVIRSNSSVTMLPSSPSYKRYYR
jgi:hypothetical protein